MILLATGFLWECSDLGEPEQLRPELLVETSAYDFPELTIGATQQHQLRLINTGDVLLNGELILLQDSAAFSLVPAGGFRLPPGDTLELSLRFRPAAAVTYTALLEINTNIPDRLSDTIQISGTGTTALVPLLSIATDLIDFGSILTNETSQQNLQLTSTGTATLQIDSLAIRAVGITTDAVFPQNLEPAASLVIRLTFTPDTAGTYTGVLLIYSNAAESVVQLNVVGLAEEEVSYTAAIQPIWSANCTGCHGGSGGLTLTSYSKLMAGNSNNGPVVLPGDGANSRIIRKLRGTADTRMPLNRTPLPTATIALIETWIDQGALNN